MAGVAAAFEASRAGARVVLLEASGRLGGKVAVSEVGGLPVDEGADAMLARVPEGVSLAEDAGLGDELVSPTTGEAGLWTRGRVRPLPTGTVLGVPADLAALARSRVLTPAGLARVPLDLVLPGEPVRDDVSVGALVRRRLGAEVLERLVDPLLGGVYA
nr:FAD-dependent oxidoreductase [Actinomycetota bacterium]